MTEGLPWHWAFERGFSDVVVPIAEEWGRLLTSPNVREHHILQFLGQHPYFFFVASSDTQFVLRELRLGSEFAIDFVVPRDSASCGMEYELIEVERPEIAPFTSKGDPSARLTHAQQQILDWKAWIEANPAEADRLFPAPAYDGNGFEHAFSYTIIIGTRENTRGHTKKRNAWSRNNGIQIRSFDSLSDQLRKAPTPGPGPLVSSAEAERIPFDLAWLLKNPFYVALGDADWRSLRRHLKSVPHLVELNAEAFAKTRRFNQEALSRLQGFCAGQPLDEVTQELTRMRALYPQRPVLQRQSQPAPPNEVGFLRRRSE